MGEPCQPAQASPECASHLEQDEAGHRLANLLQIMLRNLERAADGSAKLTIIDARKQVDAARRVQNLLNGRGMNEQSVTHYLHALIEALESLLHPAGHQLTAEMEGAAEDILLPVRALSGLGQLVAEAVMNAAKHAFPAGPGGMVTLRLSRAGMSCCAPSSMTGLAATARPDALIHAARF